MKQTGKILGRTIVILYVLQISLLGCVASTDSIIKQNRKLIFKDQNYTKAMGNLEKAVKNNPNDPELWYWLAMAQFPAESPEKTLRSLNKAFRLGLPKSRLLALYIAGDCNDSLGNYNNAIKYFTGHLTAKPKDLKVLEKRGRVYIKVEKYEQAHKDFDAILQQDNNHLGALRGKNLAYSKTENYTKAIENFDRLIGITPENNTFVLSESYGGRGWCHYHLSQFQKAKNDFDFAIRITPEKNHDAIKSYTKGKAFCYLGLKDPETAIALIDKAEKYSRPGKNLNLERTLIYYLSGNKQKAWDLRGGAGMVGLRYRINRTGVQGIYVDAVFEDGPAARSGLLKGDIITSVNGQAVSEKKFGDLTAKLMPGKTAVIGLKREGFEKKINLQVGSFEKILDSHPLSQPILSPKKQSVAVKDTSKSTLVLPIPQKEPLDVSGAGETPQLITHPPKVKAAEIKIDSVSIEPEPVRAGKHFEIIIDLIASDPGSFQPDFPIVMDYSIFRGKKLLKKFKTKEFTVPNGEYHILIRKPRAGKTKGSYSLLIELGYRDKKTSKKIPFEIK
jgi:tetratricopeptide (TPR) repeat protein